MKIKCGIDLVKDERIAQLVTSQSFIDRVFLPTEISTNIQSLATIIALKEAVSKALEITPPPWKKIEVLHKQNGKTKIVLHDKIITSQIASLDSCVTHADGVTIACVSVLLHQDNS